MILLRIARWLLRPLLLALALALLVGALPFELAVAVLRGAWWLVTLPLVALPAPLGSLVLACALAGAVVAFVHDAVLWEDYRAGEAKLREVRDRRRWLPW